MVAYPQGKGNLLDLVEEFHPKLTGEYIRLQGDDSLLEEKKVEFIRQTSRNTGEPEHLLRSDATCEDTFAGASIASFAGMFDSRPVDVHTISHMRQQISDPHDFATLNPLRIAQFFDRLIDDRRKRIYEMHQYKNLSEARLESIQELRKEQGKLAALSKKFSSAIGENSLADGMASLSGSMLEHKLWEGYQMGSIARQALSIREYAAFRGADIFNSRMDFILHKRYNGSPVLIAEHPNIDGLFHVEHKNFAGLWVSRDVYARDIHREGSAIIPLLESYRKLMKHLRSQDKLNPELAYMAECVSGSNKIVQIRPYFKRQITGQKDASLLGVIPKEGIEFIWDDSYERHRNIEIYSRDFHASKRDCALDIERKEQIRVLVLFNNQYLSHAGVRNLEAIDVVDTSSNAFSTYSRLGSHPHTVRYIQRPEGTRSFEIKP